MNVWAILHTYTHSGRMGYIAYIHSGRMGYIAYIHSEHMGYITYTHSGCTYGLYYTVSLIGKKLTKISPCLLEDHHLTGEYRRGNLLLHIALRKAADNTKCVRSTNTFSLLACCLSNPTLRVGCWGKVGQGRQMPPSLLKSHDTNTTLTIWLPHALSP